MDTARWTVHRSGSKSAAENMAQDAQWLEQADRLQGPLLHFYEWQHPSATYGYFTRPEHWLHLDIAKRLGLDLARRPTGGGIVFHLFDMAFSVIVPSHAPEFSSNTLENYALVNQAVLGAVKEFLKEKELELIPEDAPGLDISCSSFCMAKPTKYDVVFRGKKVAGAAQRKTKLGFLHQGTIALILPPEEWLDALLLPGLAVKRATLKNTYPLLGTFADDATQTEAKRELQRLLTIQLTDLSI